MPGAASTISLRSFIRFIIPTPLAPCPLGSILAMVHRCLLQSSYRALKAEVKRVREHLWFTTVGVRRGPSVHPGRPLRTGLRRLPAAARQRSSPSRETEFSARDDSNGELRVTGDDDAAVLMWAAAWLDEHRDWTVTGIRFLYPAFPGHEGTTATVVFELASPGTLPPEDMRPRLGPWHHGVPPMPA
jgi:hypothetical protein